MGVEKIGRSARSSTSTHDANQRKKSWYCLAATDSLRVQSYDIIVVHAGG